MCRSLKFTVEMLPRSLQQQRRSQRLRICPWLSCQTWLAGLNKFFHQSWHIREPYCLPQHAQCLVLPEMSLLRYLDHLSLQILGITSWLPLTTMPSTTVISWKILLYWCRAFLHSPLSISSISSCNCGSAAVSLLSIFLVIAPGR